MRKNFKGTFKLAEGGRRPLLNLCSRKFAFTLAEVLITLAIIGIVAALTIPALIQNHNEKAWSTAKNLLEKKLVEVTRRMNIDDVMTGYSTTEAYMDTFKKYLKIIKTCDNTEINKCYSPQVFTTGKDGEVEVATEDLKKAKNLSFDFNTNTMAFVIADGTTVIMAYNPNCPTVDPISQAGQAGQVSCMGMVIDVNGKKGPNRVGKDIQLSSGVAFSTCDNPIGDMCFSTDFASSPIDTCDGTNPYDLDYTSAVDSGCTTNYWAGAKQACDEKGMRLPNMAELAQLASIIYGANIGEMDDYRGSPLPEYANAITFNDTYWSTDPVDEEEYALRCVFGRYFHMSSTSAVGHYYNGKTTEKRTICLGS